MHDAVRDKFGPIVIPAHGAHRRMGGCRGELLQSEDGHGGSGRLDTSVKTYLRGGQRTLKPLGSNRVVSMKLDFCKPIATFRIVSRPLPSSNRAFPTRMAPGFSDIVEEARLSARALKDYGDHFFRPTVRLGVTALSRAGKTVFITALIHGLTRGGRFPIFEPFATGRIARARLEPQPDDAVPRFDYENHVRTLIEERRWPNSTVDISELRIAIDYQRQNGAHRTLPPPTPPPPPPS